MRRYLVVAHQTLTASHLEEHIRACLAAGECSFHLLVPERHGTGTWTEGQVRAAAAAHLEEGLARFRELGATEVSGEVGDANPVRAVGDVMRDRDCDEVILSTLPPGPSRWLRQDVFRRLQRHCGLPITHVVAQPAEVGAG